MSAPSNAQEAVFVKSHLEILEGQHVAEGYDFEGEMDYNKLLSSFAYSGYQASGLHKAFEVVNSMINWRLSDEELTAEYRAMMSDTRPSLLKEDVRSKLRTTIFLGYSSNLISSGLRETFRYLVKNKMVDCIVTTAGGVEEDFIKCLADTYTGDWALDGQYLRENGINRIGNLLVPNDNYCAFEEFMMPVLDQCLAEQNEGTFTTPSSLIKKMGEAINDEDSVYYWAAKNDIPVFCPAITDGSIGDMLYFHSFQNPGLIVDVVADIRKINNLAASAIKTGAIVLGGGVCKHHIFNANLMRNGLDYVTILSTAQEFDGSDGGARIDESVSWGKVKADAKKIKVFGDATILFPLVVSQTFKKHEADLKGSFCDIEETETIQYLT